MRISDWSSDVCSSDLGRQHIDPLALRQHLPFLWMVDAVPAEQGTRYRYRLIGTEIVAARGGDDTGKFVDEVNRELAGRQDVSARFALVLLNGRAHWRQIGRAHV